MSDKNYDDIINLPHHVSVRRPQMSMSDRAAQFAPFAALSTHGSAIKETARLTDKKLEITEDKKTELDGILNKILSEGPDKYEVFITYFIPDEKKQGGRYETETGYIKKIDSMGAAIIMEQGLRILIEDVFDICIQE